MKDILAKLADIENKKPLNEAKELSELKAGDEYGDDATAIGNGEMNAAISEDDEICSNCNGSGEGQYDGTTCSSCGGSGTNRSNSEEHDEDEREWQRKSKEDRELDEGAKYKPETPYGVQYKVFAGKEQRLTTKEAWFKSAEAMKRGIAKIENLDGFYEIVGHHYPEDMMKEAAEEVTEFNDFDAPDDRQSADNGAFSSTGAPCPESAVDEHIVKTGSQYELKSHKGKNLGKFKSHKAAAKHEGEVEWFKSHPHESIDEATISAIETARKKLEHVKEVIRGFEERGMIAPRNWEDKLKAAAKEYKSAKKNTMTNEAEDEPQAWKVLKGTDDKIYQIYVMHNYYNGKYYDYGGRAYPILASSPEEALEIARKYKGEIEADLRSKFFKVGSRRVRMISKNDNHHLKDESFHSPKYPNMWTSGGNRHVINKDGEFVSFPSKDEESSTITELSKNTLGSYVKKASNSRASYGHDWDNGRLAEPGSGRTRSDVVRKNKNRKAGINTAVDKLTRESKENIMKSRKIVKESLTFLEHITDPALEKVLRHFGKEVKDFIHGGELDDSLYNALYDYYFDEMPYGTKKARTGDPFEWITNRLDKDLKGISVGHPADAADYAGMNEPSFAKTRPIGFPGDEADYDMDEGAAGDIGGDSGSGNDISPLSQVDEEEIDLDDLDDDEDLDEALTPAQQAKMAELRAKNANSPITIGRNAIPPKAAPYNPFADEKNDRSGDLAFNQQDSFQGYGAQREGLGEEELDETFLVEDNEGLIAEILEEHGLDHGLDFFFDNGLVAIGKSTARVIINALKADPRITATPSFGRIDGEEVQIAFNKEAGPSISNAEIKDLATEPEQDALGEGLDHSEVAQLLAKAARVMSSAKTLDQLRVAEKYAKLAYKKIKGNEGLAGSNFERNWAIYSAIEHDLISKEEELRGAGAVTEEGDDALNDMRRLSGLPGKEETTDGEVDEAEGEYVNAPDPTVHTSTTDMINRGNDLNRPKRQDFTIRNLGNNPMAETRNLFKQYEAIKDTVKK